MPEARYQREKSKLLLLINVIYTTDYIPCIAALDTESTKELLRKASY